MVFWSELFCHVIQYDILLRRHICLKTYEINMVESIRCHMKIYLLFFNYCWSKRLQPVLNLILIYRHQDLLSARTMIFAWWMRLDFHFIIHSIMHLSSHHSSSSTPECIHEAQCKITPPFIFMQSNSQ